MGDRVAKLGRPTLNLFPVGSVSLTVRVQFAFNSLTVRFGHPDSRIRPVSVLFVVAENRIRVWSVRFDSRVSARSI